MKSLCIYVFLIHGNVFNLLGLSYDLGQPITSLCMCHETCNIDVYAVLCLVGRESTFPLQWAWSASADCKRRNLGIQQGRYHFSSNTSGPRHCVHNHAWYLNELPQHRPVPISCKKTLCFVGKQLLTTS